MDRAGFEKSMRRQIFWITRCIAQGPFATEARGAELLMDRVTHVLNVSDTPCRIHAGPDGFEEVAWEPVSDLERIPDELALRCLDTLHRMLTRPESRVYVHCVAGQIRSPTILWLYFVACGLSPSQARQRIEERTLDAVAGHSRLIDRNLVELVQRHGKAHYQPLPRPEILELAEGYPPRDPIRRLDLRTVAVLPPSN